MALQTLLRSRTDEAGLSHSLFEKSQGWVFSFEKFASGAALAAEMGIPAKTLEESFAKYNQIAVSKQVREKPVVSSPGLFPPQCPFGKKFFHNAPFEMGDNYHVAIVTPVVHYCMGGLHSSAEAEVVPGSTAARHLSPRAAELCFALCDRFARMAARRWLGFLQRARSWVESTGRTVLEVRVLRGYKSRCLDGSGKSVRVGECFDGMWSVKRANNAHLPIIWPSQPPSVPSCYVCTLCCGGTMWGGTLRLVSLGNQCSCPALLQFCLVA